MATAVAHAVRPGEHAPELALASGGTFSLAERRPDRFTMVVFNRGLHCPVCQVQRWPPVGRTDGRTWGETDGH